MNYLQLINRFWQLDEEWGFTPAQTRLYFYLLALANRLQWPPQLQQGEQKLAACCGVSHNTIPRCREVLCKAGLIELQTGHKQTFYRIMPPVMTPKQTTQQGSSPYNNNKLNKNGSINSSKLQERLALVGSRYDTGF